MRLRNTILVLLIYALPYHSSATVLSTSTRFISFYDKAFTRAFKKSEYSLESFIGARESSGLSKMIEGIRMMRAVLLSETKSNPTNPKDIYLGQLWNLQQNGLVATSVDQFLMFSSLSPLSGPGGQLDNTFEGLQRNKGLNEDLKKVLLMVLEILNESSEFINSCSELGLLEELQDIKREIEELTQGE